MKRMLATAFGLALVCSTALAQTGTMNPSKYISGCASATGTSGTVVIAAQGAGTFIAMTTISSDNSGASASTMTIQSDPAGTPGTLWHTMNPAGGGSNMEFPIGVIVPANKAVGFTAGTASTTQTVCISGYKFP
jgi:hypothetical protein